MRLHVLRGMVLLLFLGVLAACGSTPASASHQVNVTLADFKIQADQTTFTAGTTYHIVVTNNGHTSHEFMIMPPLSGQMPMGQMDSRALYHVDASKLPAGASTSFDYTFSSSANQQSLEFACHLPGHYEAGMHIPITIT